MQELIDQQQQHSGFVVIAPQVNYIPSLTSPSQTLSPNNNNNWIAVSSNICEAQASYQPQYMSETYPFASHIATNSIQKTPITHNYFQSELETMSNQSEPHSRNSTLVTANKSTPKKKKTSKSTYKHIPHREKPTHLVARRNARERRRVQAVNTAFTKLRKCVPVENRNKRLSKVKTLQRAIEYIAGLQELIREADERDGIVHDSHEEQITEYVKCENESTEKKYNKENRIGDQKWISIDMECDHYADPYLNNYNNYRYLKCMP